MIQVKVDSAKLDRMMQELLDKGEQHLHNALLKSALTVQDAAIKKTPKDTGKLRSSYYVQWEAKGIVVGNSAEYALAVHEALGTMQGIPRPAPKGSFRGYFWDNGEPKFLERAISESTYEIIKHFEGALNATFS